MRDTEKQVQTFIGANIKYALTNVKLFGQPFIKFIAHGAYTYELDPSGKLIKHERDY